MSPPPSPYSLDSASIGGDSSALLSLLLLLAVPVHSSTTTAITGSLACLNASICTGEGEMCSETYDGSDVNSHFCECWKTYYKSGNGCKKLIFYSLTLNNMTCIASDESKTAEYVDCTNHLEVQLKKYFERVMPGNVTLEIVSQKNLLDGLSHVGSTNVTGIREKVQPTPRILLATRASLVFNEGMCTGLQVTGNETARCNGSLKHASAELLCQSDRGNPCDLLTTQCHAFSDTVLCICKHGYSRVPGNRWMCMAKCLPSERWDDNLNTCRAKCHKASCHNSGECIATNDGHVCRCPAGYDGIDCGHWSGKKFEDLKWITVGIGLATVMLMLLLVTVVCIVCCTDRCQKLLCEHRQQLGPIDELERLSCFSSAARSALKDYDTNNEHHEMTKQKTKDQIQRNHLVTAETSVTGKANGHRTSADEHASGGLVNESYIPEANFDLDTSEEKGTVTTSS